MPGSLRPGGSNFATRYLGVAGDGAVAAGAFLTGFSRTPDADEKADVAAALAGRADDRAVAIAELLWAMLSSTEFRFNH